MVKMDILVASIVLLYRERENGIKDDANSSELIRSIINLNKPKKKDFAYDGEVGDLDNDITTFVTKMINEPSSYDDLTTLLGELKIIFRNNLVYYESIKDQLNTEMTEGGKKRSISTLRNKLLTYYNETLLIQQLNRLSFNLSNGKIEKSVQEDVMKILPELEALCKKTKTNDPGLMDTLTLSSTEEIKTIQSKLLEEKQEGGIFKTGWRQLNTMLQGGFRKSEFAVACALQHNYKSGFTQSLVMQLARYNKAILRDKTKKPAIMYISLEDEIPNVLKFMYKYLYYNENRELPDNTEHDLTRLSPDELKNYIMERLGVNGFEVILIRADPALWTYHNVIAAINKYEALGYEVQALFIDYLSKLPTIGCENNGVPGNALRDLFNRLRNYSSSKGIFTLTPHQLSVDAKVLIRNGVSEANFVKEIAGKGYTEGSKQIDQVVDLEIYIHKAKINKQWCLTFQRGKHRGQGIIDDNDMYFVLPFPPKAPILENINSQTTDTTQDVVGDGEDVFEV